MYDISTERERERELHLLLTCVFLRCPVGAVPHRPVEGLTMDVKELDVQGRRSYESTQGIRINLFE